MQLHFNSFANSSAEQYQTNTRTTANAKYSPYKWNKFDLIRISFASRIASGYWSYLYRTKWFYWFVVCFCAVCSRLINVWVSFSTYLPMACVLFMKVVLIWSKYFRLSGFLRVFLKPFSSVRYATDTWKHTQKTQQKKTQTNTQKQTQLQESSTCNDNDEKEIDYPGYWGSQQESPHKFSKQCVFTTSTIKLVCIAKGCARFRSLIEMERRANER